MQTYPQSAAHVGTEAASPAVAETTAAAPFAVRGWLRAALALIIALYLRAVGFAPVYDDNVISQWDGGWRDVPKYFVHDIFGSDGQAHSVYYRPLSLTWAFLVNWATGGAPGWLHLSALLVHLTVVVLAFVLGRKLLGDERLALLAALLYGLHPSKVESVAWIGSSYVDGLGGVLFFATLIAFVNWREGLVSCPARWHAAGLWRAASVALFACAMFTKETMLSIPILLAAYLWMPPAAGEAREVPKAPERLWIMAKALFPYAVVWAGYMSIRHRVIRPAGPAVAYLHPTYTLSNIWTAPYAAWWYLRHLAMPWGLAVEYSTSVLERPSLIGFVLPAAGLLVLALGAWAVWRRTRSAAAAFLGLWFVINLAPPVIVAPMVQQHDRYLYLSAYPFCALVAWAILRLGSLPWRARFALGLAVAALCSALTWHEMGYWDSDATLWARVLQISPGNIDAQVQMAYIYSAAGDRVRALGVLDEGLRSHPDSPGLWLARADITANGGEARAAYLNVMRVTAVAPGQSVPPGQRANARASAAYQLARLDLAAENFSEGEHYARIALALRPEGAGYHLALAENLRGQGHKAEADAENALELRLRLEQQRRLIAQSR